MDPEYELRTVHWSARSSVFESMVEEAAERGQVFTITSDGKPLAVIIGLDELARLRQEIEALRSEQHDDSEAGS